jgi:histidine triad (HIT) family protein
MSDCIFCRIVAGEIPAKVVHEDEQFLAFEDVSKQAPAHVLVIPKRHVARLTDLTEEDASFVGEWLMVGNRVAAEAGVAGSGYRLVANCNEDGGQTVFHIHLHVLGGRAMTWPPG